MRKLKVAMAQTYAVCGNTEYNLQKCLAYIDMAGKQGADIICFPELMHTGYLLDEEAAWRAAESQQDAEFRARISVAAEKNKIQVIYSYIEKTADGLYIAAMLFDKQGSVVGNYRKIYLWDKEQSIYQHGKGIPVFEADGVKIGILICYDIEYPETARELWKQQADVIFAPMHFWTIDYLRKYLQAMAFYNTIPVIAVNALEADGSKSGCSMAWDCLGQKLAECAECTEELKIVDISLEDTTTQRRIHREEYRESIL